MPAAVSIATSRSRETPGPCAPSEPLSNSSTRPLGSSCALCCPKNGVPCVCCSVLPGPPSRHSTRRQSLLIESTWSRKRIDSTTLPRGPSAMEFACTQSSLVLAAVQSVAGSSASNVDHRSVSVPVSGVHSQIASPITT